MHGGLILYSISKIQNIDLSATRIFRFWIFIFFVVPRLFASNNPADTDGNSKITLNESTAYGACWKIAPLIPTGSNCPSGANLNDAVRAGTLWNATSDGSYHFDSSLTCPLCYVPGTAQISSTGTLNWAESATVTPSYGQTMVYGVAADTYGAVIAVGGFEHSATFQNLTLNTTSTNLISAS